MRLMHTYIYKHIYICEWCSLSTHAARSLKLANRSTRAMFNFLCDHRWVIEQHDICFVFGLWKKIPNYTLWDTEKRRLCVSHRYWLWIVLSNATNLKIKLMPLLTQYDWYSKQIILLLTHNIHQSAMKNVIMRFDTLIQQPDNFIFFYL